MSVVSALCPRCCSGIIESKNHSLSPRVRAVGISALIAVVRNGYPYLMARSKVVVGGGGGGVGDHVYFPKPCAGG